ncbi:MAG: hybrid sensor histidine kinase/response regulator [Magnetovibrio sp.]|nr:hybrid sensor histidine kinase/response regulator [Magnetovibrio sp.]
MKILLVEDSSTSVLMVRSLLNEDPTEDYDLIVAGTVQVACDKLASEDFDLILLDLTLPDSYGLATVDSVFAAAEGTGIVVLTSTSDEKVGLAALQHGAQDFLIKDETYRKVLLRAVKYARQRAKSEQEVREAKELAEFATRSKSSFIANLSHELRTPLNAVIGFSEMMLSGISGELNEKQREYTQDIMKSGRYLHGLIGTVLDISKIEADRLELHDGVVDMEALINDVVERVGGAYPSDNIVFRIEVDDAMPTVRADHTMMAQIVTNW